MVASAEGIVIAASWYGKLKTVLQIVAILLFLVKDSALLAQFGADFNLFVQAAAWTVMGAAVIVTIMSMIDYFRSAADVLIGPWTGESAIATALANAEEVAEDASDETLD
jgi:phosphatidylglycerophosphate synthase